MKKTLKILMAIILFAVVLTIATSVNAATISADSLAEVKADDGTTPKYMTVATDALGNKTYTMTANYNGENGDLVVTGPATLVITKGVTVKSVTFSGKVVLQESATGTGNATITKAVNNGELTVKSGTVTDLDNTATLTVDGGTFTNPVANTGKVIANAAVAVEVTSGTVESAKGVTATVTYPATVENNYAEYVTLDKDGADDGKIYAPKADVTVSVAVTETVEGKEVAVTKLEAGKVYNIATVAKIGDVAIKTASAKLVFAEELTKTGDLTFTKGADDSKGTIKIASALVGKEIPVTVVFNAKNTELKIGEVVTPEEPGTTDPENPGTTTPTEPTTPGNDDEHDNSPETGDHIIPATAILAVVVVANVVYFARSKRS